MAATVDEQAKPPPDSPCNSKNARLSTLGDCMAVSSFFDVVLIYS
jgi:hypothetical protein